MVTMFILIVSLYCLAGIMVHLYYSISQLQSESEKHYVLYTENEVDILEWYYRCFKRFSKTMGVNVSITFVAGAPTSQSILLINRWQKYDDLIKYVESYETKSEKDIHINLNNAHDLQKLPF